MLVYSLLGIFNVSLDHLKTRNKEKSKRGTTVVIYFFSKTLKEHKPHWSKLFLLINRSWRGGGGGEGVTNEFQQFLWQGSGWLVTHSFYFGFLGLLYETPVPQKEDCDQRVWWCTPFLWGTGSHGMKRLKGLSRLSSPVTVFRQKSKGRMVRCLIPGT